MLKMAEIVVEMQKKKSKFESQKSLLKFKMAEISREKGQMQKLKVKTNSLVIRLNSKSADKVEHFKKHKELKKVEWAYM